MAESRIKDENYYQISGFMINRLKLKGVQLSVYAIIYGFTQDGETEFTGSLQYLCDFCGGVSKPTMISALKSLVESGCILKREEFINGVKFNRYKANLPLLKKFNGGVQNSSNEVVKNFEQGSKEILPNNICDNNIPNIINNNIVDFENEFELLWNQYPIKKGKKAALKAYLKARKNGVSFETIESGIKQLCTHISIKAVKMSGANSIPYDVAKAEVLKYVKHGSTWFNGECWNDEYIAPVPQKEAPKYNVKGVTSL